MKKTVIGLLGLCLSATTAAADSNLVFILDASNSMWGQVDGSAKIQTAKTSLMNLMSDLPKGTRVGLMAYGHNDKDSCTDVQMMVPVGQAAAATVGPVLANLTPKGKTPIAYAIEQSAGAFAGEEPGNNNVVLISDGVETCDGDPCAAAEKLAASNVNVRVHVVGFDISDKDRAALECIAEKGKGKYFAANSTEQFAAAVTQSIQVAQAPREEPKPKPQPVAQAFFVDDFEGGELAGHWQVHNENQDKYVVEDGKLLMLTSGRSGMRVKDTPNLFKLKTELPNGDWDLTVDLTAEFATGRDVAWLGVHEDEKNFIGAALWARWNDNPGYCAHFEVSTIKMAGGEESSFSKRIAGTGSCGLGKEKSIADSMQALAEKGGKLTLSKRGRQYSASYSMAGENDVHTTDPLSVIRLKGDPTLAVGQSEARKGETLVFADKVEITTR